MRSRARARAWRWFLLGGALSAAAVGDGGGILPDPDDSTYPLIAFLDLWFLVLEGGRIRTHEEYERLLGEAGYAIARVVTTKSEFAVVEAKPRRDDFGAVRTG